MTNTKQNKFLCDCLPFDNPRKQQVEALKFIQESKKRFIVLEMPTWSWKSWVAFWAMWLWRTAFETESKDLTEDEKYDIKTSSNWYSSYILTSQKILQDQYKEDFSKFPWFFDMRWAANYWCDVNKEVQCNKWPCKIDKEIAIDCRRKWICKYFNSLNNFASSRIWLTNYTWFQSFNMNSPNWVALRDFMILDEAHNLENEVTKFFTIKINADIFDRNTIIPIKYCLDRWAWTVWDLLKNSKVDEAIWILLNHFHKVEQELSEINIELEDLKKRRDKRKIAMDFWDWEKEELWVIQKMKTSTLLSRKKKLENLVKHLTLLSDFDWETWIKDSYFDWTDNYIEFKPVTVWRMIEKNIFNYWRKVIMLSATIWSKSDFCKTIWLKESQVEFKSFDSTFPIKNREIHPMRSAKMWKAHIESWLPLIVASIERILEEHHRDKWIIHTQSYKILDYIKENISDEYKRRIIFWESWWNAEAIDEHINWWIRNSVLCSPAMAEWVDLSDDLSRFQIIVKVPFPYLWDPLIKARAEMNDRYIAYEMIKKIIQMSWRSIRHEDDKCETYVLDSAFEYWMEQNKDYLPWYFYESIQPIT